MRKYVFFLIVLMFSERAYVSEIVPSALFDQDGNVINEDQINEDKVNWKLLDGSKKENETWRSVGEMIHPKEGGFCTATLIKPPGCENPPADVKPIVITNGHCTDFGGTEIAFNYFKDQQDKQIKKKLITPPLYSTMKKFDIGFQEVDATYAELAAMNVIPKTVSQERLVGDIRNIAIPRSSLDQENRFLRDIPCSTQGATPILEGSYLWSQSTAMNCSAVGGSSGSGLFNPAGELTGLVNTTVYKDNIYRPECGDNNPCEIGAKDTSMRQMTYGQETRFLHGCFTNCRLDLKQPGCALPAETEMIKTTFPQNTNDPKKPFVLSHSNYTQFKTKICSLFDTTCSCDNPTGYRLHDNTKSLEQLAGGVLKDGRYKVCTLGGGNGTWQPAKEATEVPVNIDRVPPAFKAENKGEGASSKIFVDPRSLQYEIAIVKDQSLCGTVPWHKTSVALDNKVIVPIIMSKNMKPELGMCLKVTDPAGNSTTQFVEL